jgi:hypothetical protein
MTDNMILQMTISRNSSYNNTTIYGLGNSLLNFLLSNKILTTKFSSIKIEKEQCLCLLKDDSEILHYNGNEFGVFTIYIYNSTNSLQCEKVGNLLKIIDFLKHMNNLFYSGEVNSIKIQMEENSELL